MSDEVSKHAAPRFADDERIMISALEHYAYCPRQCALIDEEEDSLRIYRLAQPTEETVRTWGRDDTLDLDEPLVL